MSRMLRTRNRDPVNKAAGFIWSKREEHRLRAVGTSIPQPPAGMRPSARRNLPWSCEHTYAALASGTWLVLGKEKVWLLEINGLLCRFWSHHECKLSWDLSSYPGPQSNQCCRERKGWANKPGGKRAITSLATLLGWGPVSCQHQYGRVRVGQRITQAKVSQKQEQRQTLRPGLWTCSALQDNGQGARSLWSQQPETPGCCSGTWWVIQDQGRTREEASQGTGSQQHSPVDLDISEGNLCPLSDHRVILQSSTYNLK